jgi:glycosyltransferase involved in cell wall biosynthesis
MSTIIDESTNLVSIVLAVYQGERFLKEAIDSIKSQTYSNIQLIIVDDGSTDKTPIILKEYDDILVLTQSENKGVAAARNMAIQNAKGKYLTFLDADDIAIENRIIKQVEHLLFNKSHDIVYGKGQVIVDASAPVKSPMFNFMLNKEKVHIMTMMCLTSVFELIGPFNESMRSGSDFEWLTRATALGLKSHIMKVELVKRRIHDANITLRTADRKQQRLKTIYDMIRTRRDHEQSTN